MTTLDQFRHLTEEEGQQQRTNVRTIDVSIGHDNDFMVTQFVRVIFFTTNTTAKCSNQCADFRRGNHPVETRTLYVQNLTFQQIGRAHVLTPVTSASRMPSSA